VIGPGEAEQVPALAGVGDVHREANACRLRVLPGYQFFGRHSHVALDTVVGELNFASVGSGIVKRPPNYSQIGRLASYRRPSRAHYTPYRRSRLPHWHLFGTPSAQGRVGRGAGFHAQQR
jgi:hypothetical protein